MRERGGRTDIVAAVVQLTGTGVSPEDVVAVARRGVTVELTDQARQAMEETAAVIVQLGDAAEPVYGVSTGFGSLATTRIPPDRREELQRALRALARRRHGPAGRARGRAGDDASCARARWRWAAPARGRSSPRRCSRCSTPGSPRSCPSTGRSARAATSRRSRTAR